MYAYMLTYIIQWLRIDLIIILQSLNADKKNITLNEFTKCKSIFIHYKPVVFDVRVSLVVCPCALYLLAIVLPVLLRFTDYDYIFAIFNLCW